MLLAASGKAQDDPLLEKVKTLMDSLQVVEGDVFAPEKYEKAEATTLRGVLAKHSRHYQ